MEKEGILILLKFGEYKYMKELQQGKIYCKNLKHYSDLEKRTGDRAMGDKNEGVNIETEGIMYLCNPETGEIIKRYEQLRVETEYCDMKKMPVYCMAAISREELQEIDHDKKQLLFMPREFFSKMNSEEYWEAALMIEDKAQFFNRIKTACDIVGIECRHKYVNYTKMEKNYINREKDIMKDIDNIPFWKDEYYKNQHEYRFVFTNIRVDDNFVLDIGDISDISTLFDKEELKKFFDNNYKVNYTIEEL